MATYSAASASELIAGLQKAKGRDTIVVRGQFGPVTLVGFRIEGGVTIAAAAPGSAHFERIEVINCANLSFSGLSCWPLGPVIARKRTQYLFTADPNSSHIEVSDSVFRGRSDSDSHPVWELADWQAAKIGAVFLRGSNGVIRGNTAIGVNFGYNVGGSSSEIFGNSIFGFSGDGLRVTADNCVVIGNRISDAVLIDGNHPDGFQAFKTAGLLNGLVVKDNVILEWTVRPDNRLRAKLQGLGLHDGPYANVVIRDNSIACSAVNGIRVNAATNVEVTGNRVRSVDRIRGKWPAIRLTNCSGKLVVDNNQAEKFMLPPGIGRRNRKPDYIVPF